MRKVMVWNSETEKYEETTEQEARTWLTLMKELIQDSLQPLLRKKRHFEKYTRMYERGKEK